MIEICIIFERNRKKKSESKLSHYTRTSLNRLINNANHESAPSCFTFKL